MDGRYADIGVSGFSLIILLAFVTCLVTYYFFLRKWVGRKAILGILAIFLAGYAIRLFILLRNPLIYGIDGPWYVREVGHIIQHGTMTEFTAPLVMYFTAGFSAFAGDVTLGIKVSQAFFSALPILTIWLLARYITKNNYMSFVAALLVALSAMTVGMSDVLRNTGALAFLPLFYLFFFKFVNKEGREWTIRTPLKIRGRKLGLSLSTNLVLTFLIFLVILGCHFLTAGFAIMTVVAYVAFFTGYRRKIPWRELKFVALLGVIMLVGIAASSTLRNKILLTAKDISTSEPVPADLFPFSQVTIPTPGDGGGGPSEGPFMFFVPFIILSLPAMWFTLRHHDRRHLLFTATIPLGLLCSQSWITYFMYSFRFLVMIYVALFILMGISIWCIKKHLRKVATGILAGAVGFSFLTLAGMGAMAGPFGVTEEDWAELSWIGKQLPEDCAIMTPGMGESLFYWGPVLFGTELGTTFMPGGPASIEGLAGEITGMEQRTGMTCLALVERNLIAGVENLEKYGLELYDNVKTEHYCVLKLAENSNGTWQRSATPAERPGGLPVYEDATPWDLSQTELQELIFPEHEPPPGVSMAAYTTLASPSAVASWYGARMPKLGWTLEENTAVEYSAFLRYSKAGRGAMISAYENYGVNTILTLAEWGEEEWGPEGGPEEGGPFPLPAATSEIKFNHNPLFAFILLPIELVQGLYGTGVYGILKLVIAIPLSIGLIGFLIGLVPLLTRKFRKVRRGRQSTTRRNA